MILLSKIYFDERSIGEYEQYLEMKSMFIIFACSRYVNDTIK